MEGDVTVTAVEATTFLPGDCVEVLWDSEEKFFPGILTQQRPDVNSTTASCLRYDDDPKTDHWHNLAAEQCHKINPTMDRLKRLQMKTLRWRLKKEGIKFKHSDRKSTLILKLFSQLTHPVGDTTDTPVDVVKTGDTATTVGMTTMDSTTTMGVETTMVTVTKAGAVTGVVAEVGPRTGDCVGVWWLEHQMFLTGVIGEQLTHANDTIMSLVLYDGKDDQKYFHDMESEIYRPICPTIDRIRQLSVKSIHWRLRKEGVNFKQDDGKEIIEKLLFTFLKHKFVTTSRKKPYAPRAKLGFSHKQRMAMNKRVRAEIEEANSQDGGENSPQRKSRHASGDTDCNSDPNDHTPKPKP